MPDVVGIRFKSGYKIYDFEVNGFDIKVGDSVVVESDFGLSIGNVIKGKQFVEIPERPLKKILRIATEEDIKAYQENKTVEKEAKVFCLERIMARGLQMKLIDVEATLDRKRIIFYFTAEGRIDFRELVKDLAARYKTRIEMRQIGVRDEAKLAGGIGICGRELCCKTFLTSFEPVSIKMVKKQDVVINVSKLSGLCGRLMCCLRFEYSDDISENISFNDTSLEIDKIGFKDEEDFNSVLNYKFDNNVDSASNKKTTEHEIEKPNNILIQDSQNKEIGDNKRNHFRCKNRRYNKNESRG